MKEAAYAAPLVLVVDDDPDFRETLAHVLQELGYRVQCASGTEEGLASMRREKPRVVILDVVMDGLDAGFTFARRLKGDPAFGDVPIVMSTSIGSLRGFDFRPRGPEDLRQMCADGYLTKPVMPDALAATLAQVLGGPPPKGAP